MARTSEYSGQPSKLWRTFCSVKGLDRVTTTTSGGPTAQSLLGFFVGKIDIIHRSTGGLPPTLKLSIATSAFDGLHKLKADEVHKFIAASKPPMSCSLEPIPTNILQEVWSK